MTRRGTWIQIAAIGALRVDTTGIVPTGWLYSRGGTGGTCFGPVFVSGLSLYTAAIQVGKPHASQGCPMRGGLRRRASEISGKISTAHKHGACKVQRDMAQAVTRERKRVARKCNALESAPQILA